MVADSRKTLQLDLFAQQANDGGDTCHGHVSFSGVTDVRGMIAAKHIQPTISPGQPMSELTELPSSLVEIAEIIGIEATHILSSSKGGQEVYIPSKANKDHWLSELLGHELANKLCAHYRIGAGGGRKTRMLGATITIPTAQHARQAKVWEEVLAMGLTVSETAALMGCHIRTVRRNRAKFGYAASVAGTRPR